MSISLTPGASKPAVQAVADVVKMADFYHLKSPTFDDTTGLNGKASFIARKSTVTTQFTGLQFEKVRALIKLHYFNKDCLLDRALSFNDRERSIDGVTNPKFQFSLDDIEGISRCFQDAVLPTNCFEHQQATLIVARLVAASKWLAPLRLSARELLIYCVKVKSGAKHTNHDGSFSQDEKNKGSSSHPNLSIVEYLIEFEADRDNAHTKFVSRASTYASMIFTLSHFRTPYNFHQYPDTDSKSDAPPMEIGPSTLKAVRLGLADDLIYSVLLSGNDRAVRSLDLDIAKWLDRRGSRP